VCVGGWSRGSCCFALLCGIEAVVALFCGLVPLVALLRALLRRLLPRLALALC